MKSTHKVEVVRLGPIEKHPNANKLGVTRIFSGYTCVVGLDQFKEGDLVAYVPPDSLVPTTHPAFAFLKREGRDVERIKVKKLRGIVSMGLIIGPVSSLGATEGEDLASYFGVGHYEPPEPLSTGGEDAPAPKGFIPCYDVDSLRRYAHVFEPGEPVWVSEKIHGANARYLFDGETMHVGSRTGWKKSHAKSIWWKALTSQIESWCRASPGWTLYGEVYGQVQDLKYGTKGVRFAVLSPEGVWKGPVIARDAVEMFGVPWVPVIASPMSFDLDTILFCAEGPSLVAGADHVREGIVVRPMVERTHPEIGRVMLKVVGNGYLERP